MYSRVLLALGVGVAVGSVCRPRSLGKLGLLGWEPSTNLSSSVPQPLCLDCGKLH